VILHVAGLAEAEAALRAWHLEQLGHDPTDPELVRRTAQIAVSAYLEAVRRWDQECREFGCHDTEQER
jgi:hypothetical protein